MKIPVLIDCFPDGNSIIDNFKTADYIEELELSLFQKDQKRRL